MRPGTNKVGKLDGPKVYDTTDYDHLIYLNRLLQRGATLTRRSLGGETKGEAYRELAVLLLELGPFASSAGWTMLAEVLNGQV